MILTFGDGRTLDVASSFPFTFGDWRALEKRGVKITEIERGNANMETFFQIVWRAIEKQKGEFTETDVETIPFSGTLMQTLFARLTQEDAPGPNPISTT
jgi:hypothetical protein